MSQGPARTRPSSSSPHDTKPRNLVPLQARTLPPIQNAIQTSASQDVFQRANTLPNAPIRQFPPSSTPPDQRTSRPIGVQNLLNPAGNDPSNTQTRQGSAGHFISPPTPSSLGPTSRGATPALPTTSGQSRSPIEGSLPNFTPPSVSAFPAPGGRAMTPRSPSTWPQNTITKGIPSGTIDARQSPFVVPRDQPSSSNAPGPLSLSEMTTGPPTQQRPYAPSLPPAPSSPPRRVGQESGYQPWQGYARPPGLNSESQAPVSQRSDSPESQYSSYSHTTAPAAMPSTVPPGQPQSFFSNPFSTTGPASTMSQTAFGGAKAFDMPTSSTTAQSQYQMMTLETEQGPIQVPVDVQAASKVADEKRKRNATASHRFRQRRKEKERETSDNIAKLEAQIRDMAEEKEHYQKERDYFQDVALRHRIPLAPRPPSPRRRRHASLGGQAISQYQDEGNGRNGRQTRRRTSAYVPPTGPPPPSQEPPLPMPPFERVSAMPSEHIQGAHRMRPQGSYPSNPGPYNPRAPR